MKTLDNLIKAFIGESQARNRYSFYARKAQKKGFEQIDKTPPSKCPSCGHEPAFFQRMCEEY